MAAAVSIPPWSWRCLAPGAAPARAGRNSLYLLAVDERPWPQDVFVHILLGEARGGVSAEEGGTWAVLWILNTFLFHPP